MYTCIIQYNVLATLPDVDVERLADRQLDCRSRYLLVLTFIHTHTQDIFIRATLYASAVFAVIACPSVHLSVCLSVTSRSCTKMAKTKITQTTPHSSPWTPFKTRKISTKFR